MYHEKIKGLNQKTITFDLNSNHQNAPLVIFAHGFKGFKDWGTFNLLSETFAQKGFCFVKLNFSHNGSTPDDQHNFADLEAFGNNNYSKELIDLEALLDFLETKNEYSKWYDFSNLTLVGHSRGGGIALLKAAADARIKKVVTLAALLDLGRTVNPPNVKEWEEKGVLYINNVRTNQQMPLYWQFRENYLQHFEDLSIELNAENINCPTLIIHGNDDEAVDVEQAFRIKDLIPHAQLEIIEETGHTFGASHPWKEETLPLKSQEFVDLILKFLKP